VALTRYRDDGRLALDNNAAERTIRPLTLGRKNRLFCGSDAGGSRAAAIMSLVQTAGHPVRRFAEPLCWNVAGLANRLNQS